MQTFLPSSEGFGKREERKKMLSSSLSQKKNPSFHLYLKFEKQGAKD